MKKTTCLAVSLCLLLAFAANADEVRIWTSANGSHKTEAEFVKVSRDDKSVSLLKTDGKEVEVLLEKLSKADQEYVQERQKEIKETEESETKIPFTDFKDIFEAAGKGTVQDIEYFLNNGANVNAKHTSSNTLLHLAALSNPNLEVLKYLVSKGANVNAKNKWGATPLHYAAMKADVEVLKYLVSKGANVNAKDNDGGTPLHVNTSVDVLKYLIAQGADVNAKMRKMNKGNKGHIILTPLDFADTEEKKAIIREALNNRTRGTSPTIRGNEDQINPNDIIIKTNPRTYNVRVSFDVTVGMSNTQPVAVVVNLPLPETNEYQKIRSIRSSHGRILTYPENDQRFLAALFTGHEQLAPGTSLTVFHEFEAMLYDIEVDFSKIEKIYPYNKNTPMYRRYTGRSGDIVIPDHPAIQRAAQQLAKESKDSLDFARKAYVFVGDNFRYRTIIGWDDWTLASTLQNGSSDCGGLSMVFISLLRSQGIPARHILAVSPTAVMQCPVSGELRPSIHAWAEFYLENYGWIPVDVTFRRGNKNGDYFGRVRQDRWQGIIFSRDADISVLNLNGTTRKVSALQTEAWWHTSTREGMVGTYRIQSRLVERSLKVQKQVPSHTAP